jgi:hypothetical protein
MIYVTREVSIYYPALLHIRGEKTFKAGLPVERANNLPGEDYWLCPFPGMPVQWREYGRRFVLSELRPATNSEINELPRATIDRVLLAADESRLWPIRGKFNATARAIRKIRKLFPEIRGLEYYLAIDAMITDIVNKAV